MTIKRILSYLVGASMLFHNAIQPKIKLIIWDLNRTLIKIDKMRFASNTFGIMNAAYYALNLPKGVTTESRLFATLERIGGKAQGDHIPCSDSGAPLPALMCKWLDGSWLGTEQDLANIDVQLKQLCKEGFFYGTHEYKFIKTMIHAMFTPSIINKYRKPMKKMLKLAHFFKNTTDCHQIVLSNWDRASFDGFLTSKAGKAVLEVVDKKDMVISADPNVQMNKPHPDIFHYVCTTYNVKPHECLFIDDQPENVKSAQACGMHAIVTTGKNSKEIHCLYKKVA